MEARAKVFSRRGTQRIVRRGRGFSQSELAEVGLSVEKAKNLGLPTDSIRKTKHADNMQVLKDWIQSRQSTEKK